MSWSTSEAFTDPAIRQPMTFRSEHKFFLRDIPVEITLRLYSPTHSDDLSVRQSHTISVPGLESAQKAACEDQSKEGAVIQSVVSEFVCVYNAAVAQGLKPDANWLTENAHF